MLRTSDDSAAAEPAGSSVRMLLDVAHAMFASLGASVSLVSAVQPSDA